MPIYEYQCDACGHRFERIQKFSDPPVDICPTCGKRDIRKLLSSPAIQFKGSGFYITDYASKGSAGPDAKGDVKNDSKPGTKNASESASSKESSPSDAAKPASSTEKSGTKSSSS
jgi:putative FmdB family regulatory protein